MAKKRTEEFAKFAELAGITIMKARKREKISVRALAKMAGISHTTLGKFESGKRRELPVGAFMAICERLGLDPVDVWYDRSRPKAFPLASELTPAPPESSDRPSSKLKSGL